MNYLVKFDDTEMVLYRTSLDLSTPSLNENLQQRQCAGNALLHFILKIRQPRHTTQGKRRILGPGFAYIAANSA
jgi:hypothetical protein